MITSLAREMELNTWVRAEVARVVESHLSATNKIDAIMGIVVRERHRERSEGLAVYEPPPALPSLAAADPVDVPTASRSGNPRMAELEWQSRVLMSIAEHLDRQNGRGSA